MASKKDLQASKYETIINIALSTLDINNKEERNNLNIS